MRRHWDLTAEAVVRSGFADAVYPPEPASPAQSARIAEVAERLGISSLLDRPILELSRGEARKLLLARALATAPEVLLLDEPLAGLDPASRAWILSAVEEACARGAALVAVTHHADELPGAMHRRLVLEGARLRAE